MAANKRKILEAARKHAQKGAKEKALKEFGKLLKLDPRDSKLRLEIGDTHRRWGQIAEAIEAYSNVADQFMQEGFDARAVAVFKQIQNLQPDSFSYCEPLAELYQRMGLTAEAIGCLESAAESHREAGQKQEALGLLRKMAAIDPSNTTSRIKVADLLQQEGLKEDAISEYDAVVAELEEQGDTEAVAKLFERILEIEPERIETLVLYVRNLIDRGSAQRAESLAKRALELDRSPDHFELLADVYRMNKREEELIALYRELAELYRERGDEERTREILQRYVPLEELGSPDTPNGYIDENEHLKKSDDPADDLAIGDETTLIDGDLLSDSSLLVSDGDSELRALDQDDGLDSLIAGSSGVSSDSNEMTSLLPDDSLGGASPGGSGGGMAKIDDSQLLVEASVYLRYGKRNQAIANLESILERDADHRPALEKLGEALAEGDDSAKAVEMWSRAAKLAAESGEADAAEVLRSRVASLDPAAAEALELAVASVSELDTGETLISDDLGGEASDDLSISDDLGGEASDDLSISNDLGGEASDDLSVADDLSGEASDDLSISDDLSDEASDDLSIADDLGDAASDGLSVSEDLTAAPLDSGSADVGGADLPELDLADVSISDMEMEIEIDVDDASFALDPSDEEETDEKEAPEPELEVAAADPAPIAGTETDEISIEDLSVAGKDADGGEAEVDEEAGDSEAQAGAGVGGSDVSPAKIAEDIEEADFYMEQGLLEEAEAGYSRILSLVPNHPHAMVRLGELASQRGDASGSVASTTDSATGVADAAAQVADSADNVSEEPAASDIGADLADWQEGLSGGEVQETNDQQGGIDSGVMTVDGPSDSAAAEVDDGATASADEQDATGEIPAVSVTPDDSVEPEGLEAPDELKASDESEVSSESEEPEAMDALETPIEAVSEAPSGEDGPVEVGDNLGFDLAAELSESFDQDPGASASGTSGSAGLGATSEDGFASVFAEFKKGVSETLTEGDHQAHYDLGIAYREMGLLSDAFTEFKLAMSAPDRRIGCLQLMGMCAHDMGEPEQALGHYTEALSSDGISEEALLAITLDLGKAHETIGDVVSARRAYEEIRAIDPDFADAASRLDELEKSEDAEPEEDDSPSTEEYETFAEFLEDHDEPDAAEPEAAADATGEAEAAPVWENFDDVVAEVEAADNADFSSEEPETATSADSASEAENPGSAEATGETETTPKRRKKKISFV